MSDHHGVRARDLVLVLAGLPLVALVVVIVYVSASSASSVTSLDVQLPAGATAAPAVESAPVSGSAVSAAWVSRTAAVTGIPAVAVRAYASAQLAAPAGCDLGWTTLAGIGWVESHHGTLGGRTLEADGLSSSPISGPPLDGGLGVARGPMQFIDATWSRWGRDASGDGVADVNNISDAALAAARYLCASGRPLTDGPAWAAAIFSYNHAQWYVDEVYAAANTYAGRAA